MMTLLLEKLIKLKDNHCIENRSIHSNDDAKFKKNKKNNTRRTQSLETMETEITSTKPLKP